MVLSEFKELDDGIFPVGCNLCLKIKVLKIDFFSSSAKFMNRALTDLWSPQLNSRCSVFNLSLSSTVLHPLRE